MKFFLSQFLFVFKLLLIFIVDGNKFAGDECGIELAKHLHKNLNMNIDDMLQRLITKYSNCHPILGKVVPSNSIPSSERIVSPQELLQNNGSSSNDLPEEGGYATLPIYVALRNKVYDVSFGGVSMYGPGGPYHKFAGRDISRALAKMSFEPEDLDNTDISDLTDRQIGVLDDWIKTYENKKLYPIVGMLNK